MSCRVFFFFTDLVAQRGEKLELLIDKTENLVDSVSFLYSSVLAMLDTLCLLPMTFPLCHLSVGDI